MPLSWEITPLILLHFSDNVSTLKGKNLLPVRMLTGKDVRAIKIRLYDCTNITKTRLFKYIETFTSKNWKLSATKDPDIFHISAQNIDCGYSLEPSRRGGSNEYHNLVFWAEAVRTSTHNLCFWAEIRKIMYIPVNPSFTIIKWGLRGSKLHRHVFMMVKQNNQPLLPKKDEHSARATKPNTTWQENNWKTKKKKKKKKKNAVSGHKALQRPNTL